MLLPSVFDLRWPPVFKSFLSYFNFISFNFVDALPVDCVVQKTYYDALLLQTLLPMGVIAAVWAVLGGVARYTRSSFHQFVDSAVRPTILILFAVYPSVSGQVLKYYSCMKAGDNFYILRYVRDTVCYDALWYKYYYFALTMVIVYPVGVPVLAWFLIGREARANRLELRATKSRYGFLYSSLRFSHWYFEELDLLRKLFLSAIAVFVFPGSPSQLILAQFVSFFALILVGWMKPYKVASDNLLAQYSMVGILIILFMAEILRLGDDVKNGLNTFLIGIMMIAASMLVFVVLLALVLRGLRISLMVARVQHMILDKRLYGSYPEPTLLEMAFNSLFCFFRYPKKPEEWLVKAIQWEATHNVRRAPCATKRDLSRRPSARSASP